MKISYILLTHHLKVYMLTLIKIHLLSSFCHLVLIHMLNLVLSPNKKMHNLWMSHLVRVRLKLLRKKLTKVLVMVHGSTWPTVTCPWVSWKICKNYLKLSRWTKMTYMKNSDCGYRPILILSSLFPFCRDVSKSQQNHLKVWGLTWLDCTPICPNNYMKPPFPIVQLIVEYFIVYVGIILWSSKENVSKLLAGILFMTSMIQIGTQPTKFFKFTLNMLKKWNKLRVQWLASSQLFRECRLGMPSDIWLLKWPMVVEWLMTGIEGCWKCMQMSISIKLSFRKKNIDWVILIRQSISSLSNNHPKRKLINLKINIISEK